MDEPEHDFGGVSVVLWATDDGRSLAFRASTGQLIRARFGVRMSPLVERRIEVGLFVRDDRGAQLLIDHWNLEMN